MISKMKPNIFVNNVTESEVVKAISDYLVTVGQSGVGEAVQDAMSVFVNDLVSRPGLVGFRVTEYKHLDHCEKVKKVISDHTTDMGYELKNVNMIVDYMILKSALTRTFTNYLKSIYGQSTEEILIECFMTQYSNSYSGVPGIFSYGTNTQFIEMIVQEFRKLLNHLDDYFIKERKL